MPSERIQRQIDSLLDEAEAAVKQLDWPTVKARAQAALGLDPENVDAGEYLGVAERNLDPVGGPTRPSPAVSELPPVHPSSFAGGRYAVKKFLGEGGKKRVYLTHDTLLDREVAFGLIKTEGLDDQGRERIRREAQAMGRMGTHPNIVSVFDLGDEDGQPYIVTELMAGGDIEALLAKTPEHQLPLDQALQITREVCRGLQFAHDKGIVHRDLKPGNVWLTQDGGSKIGDFGLAVATDRSRLTQAGFMVGTVSYMPPEQALGGNVDQRSDLYALGAMLYELVCGRPPFIGDESVAIITQHLETPPVAPSWHKPEVPAGLEALILRLLEKDPEKRPASAVAVSQALDAIDLKQPQTSEATPAIAADLSPIYRRVFVGREQELQQLKAAFDRALSGQGSLVTVVGEPGIGKTALCEQIATYAAMRGGRSLVGHCYEEGSLSLPYLPFIEALRTYVMSREVDHLKSELGTGAADVARIVSEVRQRLPLKPSPPGDPEEERYHLFQAVTGFLRNASAVQPLLIVLEDLHDADKGTMELLVHVSRNLSGARLLLVGTYRDIEVDRTHALSATLAELRRNADFDRVLLRGLTADEVERMVNAIVGQEIRWGFAEAVHRQTEGNPLFVQEVLRYLVEEGLFARQEGRWQRAGETPPEMRIPEGLRDVIGKRLSRLSAECNRLLSYAAVIGRDFDLETLRTVAATDEDRLLAALEEATHLAILQEHPPQTGRAIRYRFTHAFIRQTLYEELSAPRRLRLHQEVARALEAQYAARPEEHAAELAEHFAHSTDAADLAKAVHYGQLAADRAMAVFAYSEAVRHLEQAAEAQEVLAPDDKAARCDLLLALGEALLPAGEPLRAVEEMAEEALVLAEALDDRARASRACRLALDGLFQFGGPAAAAVPRYRYLLEQADRYAAPGTADRVRADVALGLGRLGAGQFSSGRDLAESALTLARQLGEPKALFDAAFLYFPFMPPEDLLATLGLAQEVAASPRVGVRPSVLGWVLYWCSMALLAHGERVQAEALWQETATLATRTSDPFCRLAALGAEARLAWLDGKLEQIQMLATRIIATGDEVGMPDTSPSRGLATIEATQALLLLGLPDEALALHPRPFPGSEPAPLFLALQAVCFPHLGRQVEAHTILQRLLRQDNLGAPESSAPGYVLTLLLEAAVLLEDGQSAALLSSRLKGLAGLVSAETGQATPARLLGAAAALGGDPEGARRYYEQAREVSEKIRCRPEVALTRFQLAELLLEHFPDQRAEAQGHLDFAIAEFREMKMKPALERALRHKGLLNA